MNDWALNNMMEINVKMGICFRDAIPQPAKFKFGNDPIERMNTFLVAWP